MVRSSRRRPALVHPDRSALDLFDVLHALSDPTRMAIVTTLMADLERPCGTFPVEVAPSTLTHHFRVLRDAGLIRQREDGNRRWTSLRLEDVEAQFPGLLPLVVRLHSGSGVLHGPHAPRTKEQGTDAAAEL